MKSMDKQVHFMKNKSVIITAALLAGLKVSLSPIRMIPAEILQLAS